MGLSLSKFTDTFSGGGLLGLSGNVAGGLLGGPLGATVGGVIGGAIGDTLSGASAKEIARLQAEIQREQLAFTQQRYQDWMDVYGPVEKNLGEFYNNLSAEDLTATRLNKSQTAFQATMENVKKNFAQRGLDPSTQEAILGLAELNQAKNRANIRYETPLQLAETKQNFVNSGRGSGANAAAGVTSALQNTANLYGQQYNNQVAQDTALMDTLGTAAGTAAFYAGQNNSPRVTAASAPAQNYYAPDYVAPGGSFPPSTIQY